MFETYSAYCKYREETGCWDIGQRNLALYKRLRSGPREEAWLDERCPFDHVSVDEVQDATAVELALVLSACGDQPNHLSLFGDTTQQVTPGWVDCLVGIVFISQIVNVTESALVFRSMCIRHRPSLLMSNAELLSAGRKFEK